MKDVLESVVEPVETKTLPLRPLRDFVLCRERKRGQTLSGLVVPETAWGSPRVARWRVVAIGPLVTEVKIGDAVNIEAGAAIVQEFGNEKWCGCKQEHVWSVLHEDDALQNDELIHPDEIGGRKFSAGGHYME